MSTGLIFKTSPTRIPALAINSSMMRFLGFLSSKDDFID
jgi:hypothetical protein